MRFQCLNKSGGVHQYDPQTMTRIFVACCILHIIAVLRVLLGDKEMFDALEKGEEEETMLEDDLKISSDEDDNVKRDWRLDTAGNGGEDPSGDGDNTTTRTADSERKARDTLRWEQAERPRGSVVRRHKDGGGLRRPQRADQESKWLTIRM
ncbi:hypothetical protein EOD39_13357 [Acipenser ruthenus]|uniref:Uncharacterized protein n=1 Tax=Acipenser ruthenus TaxID=7906 RepID=A0A662YRZ6_ACIRT|nr:hypothetical protein EOD39_13357 [Acipenser ruthenus]